MENAPKQFLALLADAGCRRSGRVSRAHSPPVRISSAIFSCREWPVGSGCGAGCASRHCTGHLAARRRLTRHEPAAGRQSQIAPVQPMHDIYIFHVGSLNVLAVLMRRSMKERGFHAPS